ncbi:sugar porter family MFS transporter [Legionella sp. PC997]|uniref:sugar porter family MFS transporter n=1 Tax=Legionella sp. PC997 TaxID=2755562 RepID=UPI0015FB30A0|nr:sugar porter family MFS transporter [Legionella sp. PC997]QMT61304.1 sugar porter family MFS transporter [Legionella sp. PC997]
MTWVVAIIGSVAGFLFGYDEGIIAGSIELVKNHFGLTATHVGVMASALPFGALFGSMLIGAITASKGVKRFGRRTLLSFSGVLFFLGALGAGFADSITILIISRLVLGLAIGMASVMAPLYLAETATYETRGAVVAIYQLAMTVGIVCSYSVNYLFLENNDWRAMFASSAFPALVLCIGILLMPESPRWLCSVGRREAASKALKKLRKSHSIEHELLDIERTLANEPKKGSWLLLFKSPLLPVLMLGTMLFCLQQLSGINVVIYFAPEIFKNLGMNSVAGQILATIGIGLVNLLVTVIAMLSVDKIGRRKLLLFGFSGMCFSLLFLCMFSVYQIPWLPYLSVLCLILYIFSFAVSVGPIPHIAMAEIFPLHVRGVGMGFSAMSNWTFNTIVIFSFPLLEKMLGIEYTFAVYAVICLLGLIYTYFYMPETKNISLEQIENYIMSGKPLRLLGREEAFPIEDSDKEEPSYYAST